ncbi:hypothetical protein H6F42_15850 [Pseudanabaena sp. FACHB-1998]|uniref:hypothetical protein n=1 Tax=Pseudanabaena sp. FACHB-1998 TaxID=2692858 RepID=UPI0016811514|nr:hypothetical protein [Pseudanabaena sp. FACHB-1998]MBD2178393.1 hypothetical protein [Pseudanabaena sp. FACHB-1998]
MSELTKIAAILFKNLSDALLSTASEIDKLDWRDAPPKTFTQADEKPPLLEPEKPKFITHFQYQPREKVIVIFEGSISPTKCRILKRLDKDTYVVYPQQSPKSMAREVSLDQILGLDPDR